jgi:uncharacterized protein CbrC (UPF0167 family)
MWLHHCEDAVAAAGLGAGAAKVSEDLARVA